MTTSVGTTPAFEQIDAVPVADEVVSAIAQIKSFPPNPMITSSPGGAMDSIVAMCVDDCDSFPTAFEWACDGRGSAHHHGARGDERDPGYPTKDTGHRM